MSKSSCHLFDWALFEWFCCCYGLHFSGDCGCLCSYLMVMTLLALLWTDTNTQLWWLKSIIMDRRVKLDEMFLVNSLRHEEFNKCVEEK